MQRAASAAVCLAKALNPVLRPPHGQRQQGTKEKKTQVPSLGNAKNRREEAVVTQRPALGGYGPRVSVSPATVLRFFDSIHLAGDSLCWLHHHPPLSGQSRALLPPTSVHSPAAAATCVYPLFTQLRFFSSPPAAGRLQSPPLSLAPTRASLCQPPPRPASTEAANDVSAQASAPPTPRVGILSGPEWCRAS
ncbi:hypothetical protein Taro_007614 [Colocasia esculenta]|uniref:Uncharacterized protein n=1 Tax=Colocasia esculenta TaxID=4460 RepID=A0A843TYP0_COLES|nr:hypothetical protein [Colocasia esculenta]